MGLAFNFQPIGSSTIPFDRNGYKIVVEFRKDLEVHKLPLSHTCFRSIEVPHYKNYEMLRNKCDIAFKLGSEGFGFA